jgi:tetratricopeptide (TPR) repeat protein
MASLVPLLALVAAAAASVKLDAAVRAAEVARRGRHPAQGVAAMRVLDHAVTERDDAGQDLVAVACAEARDGQRDCLVTSYALRVLSAETMRSERLLAGRQAGFVEALAALPEGELAAGFEAFAHAARSEARQAAAEAPLPALAPRFAGLVDEHARSFDPASAKRFVAAARGLLARSCHLEATGVHAVTFVKSGARWSSAEKTCGASRYALELDGKGQLARFERHAFRPDEACGGRGALPDIFDLEGETEPEPAALYAAGVLDVASCETLHWEETAPAGFGEVTSEHAQRGAEALYDDEDAAALRAFDEALRARPGDGLASLGRGVALERLGRDQEALTAYGEAMPRLDGKIIGGWNGGALALVHRATLELDLGRVDDALRDLDAALAREPASFAALHWRGSARAARHEDAAAIADYRRAIALWKAFETVTPYAAQAGAGAGDMLVDLAMPAKAVLFNNLAWKLATARDPGLRKPAEALTWASEAYELDGGEGFEFADTLAAALAATGRWAEAVSRQKEAIKKAGSEDPALRSALQARLSLYEKRRIFVP